MNMYVYVYMCVNDYKHLMLQNPAANFQMLNNAHKDLQIIYYDIKWSNDAYSFCT